MSRGAHVPSWEDFQRMKVMPVYVPRFLTAAQYAEAINFYHLARTALAGQECTKYTRMLWASKEISKKYNVSSGAAYKDLDGGLGGW
jgi:hypothetical protein